MPRLWHLLSTSAVLAVLATAMAAGLTRPSVEATGAGVRHAQVPQIAESPEYAEPAAGDILAPFTVRTAVASRGELAYALAGAGLTLEDIPPPALAAYQRAAAAIDLADRRCHLDWELVAAIGKVASDHGRADGSTLAENGVARPAVLGPRLNGRHGTPRVTDTDGGLLDRETRVDRAVGPMMLLPATWSAVSVDGDSDGRRNPQDVDDAALGVAVFLCAGPGDFRKAAHAREQVLAYHPGKEYANSVMAVRRAYRAAASVPVTTALLARESAVTVTEVAPPAPTPTPEADPSLVPNQQFQPGASPSAEGPGPASPSAPAGSDSPAPSATPSASPTPTAGPDPTGAPDPTCSPSPTPTEEPSPTSEPSPTETPTPTESPSPTESPGPSESPSANASPTASPTPGDDDCDTSVPGAQGAQEGAQKGAQKKDGVGPAAAVLVLPGAVWLWWRRRRTHETETPAG